LSGERLGNATTPVTLADGLKANVGMWSGLWSILLTLYRAGELTWPIIRDLVDDVITVSEEEIVTSMRLIWERMKIIVEPSAAVGLAAVLCDSFQKKFLSDQEINGDGDSLQHIGIIFCGGKLIGCHSFH
jgi:threonine synthase